jgi:hypothetical protein
MEIFVDFGLFELLAATGLAIVARKIYTRRLPTFACLVLSVLAPMVLLFFVHAGLIRWIAVISLATALVNVSLIVLLVRRCDVSTLLAKQPAPSAK